MSAKRIGVATLLVLGTLLWTASIFGVWANRQALQTDNWVKTSTELLADDQIRTALAVGLVERLYNSESVEARLREELPPRLDRLAAPAAAGLKEIAVRNAPRVLGTSAALTAWETANRAAHRAFVALVEGHVAPGGEVTLDVKGLLQQVAAGTGLPEGAVDKIPPNVAQLQIVQSDQLATAQDAVRLFRDLLWVLLIGSVACFAGAIALSGDRRRTILSVGACLVVAAIAALALRRVGGAVVTDALADAPNAHAVADDIWTIATSLLVDIVQGTILFAVIVMSAAWLAGPGRVATGVRRASTPALREHPGAVRAGLAVAILLLVWWGPVPWTGRVIPVLLVTAGLFAWLEWLRRRAIAEFPDVGSGELGRMLRTRSRLGRARAGADDTVPTG